ncbi:MAG TPA: bifunctional 4-hydroxy-2-oxoglutarate aldolase/2-dehydro-3-deoxy-phosphogluconate aldolase [Polyangiaceae bacterium]|jgi:2-dehydro-3-deoxyphosphogluconate aldolase/(4S)-4-hydroxy-2-oxoglutarate aldolase
MTISDVYQRIENVGIVPVVRAPSSELAIRAVEALLEGGISVLEITMTVPDAVSLVSMLRKRYGNRALVGAGTVVDAAQAHACVEAGAEFVVSPGLNLEVLTAVRARGVAMLPGALTPTEVMAAAGAGADLIKIFPCSAVGGAKYLRALRGPFPALRFLPTGGVNLATAAEYIAAGAVALGLGGELVDIALLEAGQDEEISVRARKLVAAVAAARQSLAKPLRA